MAPTRAETGVSPEPAPAGQDDIAARAKAKADSARYPYTEADVRFMSHMIGHHAQAIVMAGWAPTHGASPAVRRLAERIINAQQDEIATHAAVAPRPGAAGAGGRRHRDEDDDERPGAHDADARHAHRGPDAGSWTRRAGPSSTGCS